MTSLLAEPQQLLERARLLASLDDYGPDVLPALDAFCRLFGEVPLTQFGRRSLTRRAVQALVTRLRLMELRKRQPEIFAGKLLDPIIIVGLPRTGTTYLHGLLAQLPGRRALRMWEVREPIPDADDHRIADYEHLVRMRLAATPELAVQHPLDAHGPDECMYLLDPSFLSHSFSFVDAPCPSYFALVNDSQAEEPYQIYRQLLLYFQAGSPGQRLVLKSPSHFGMLSALLHAVPEAKLVHTHRDPVHACASLCSLHVTFFERMVEGFDRRAHARVVLDMLDCFTARHAAQREALPGSSCFDLGFAELTRQPQHSVQRLHQHFGLDWSDTDEQALLSALRGAPPQVGRHHYRLEDFGLSETEAAQRLHGYRQRWGYT